MGMQVAGVRKWIGRGMVILDDAREWHPNLGIDSPFTSPAQMPLQHLTGSQGSIFACGYSGILQPGQRRIQRSLLKSVLVVQSCSTLVDPL